MRGFGAESVARISLVLQGDKLSIVIPGRREAASYDVQLHI
jgi:hypothetical protein